MLYYITRTIGSRFAYIEKKNHWLDIFILVHSSNGTAPVLLINLWAANNTKKKDSDLNPRKKKRKKEEEEQNFMSSYMTNISHEPATIIKMQAAHKCAMFCFEFYFGFVGFFFLNVSFVCIVGCGWFCRKYFVAVHLFYLSFLENVASQYTQFNKWSVKSAFFRWWQKRRAWDQEESKSPEKSLIG